MRAEITLEKIDERCYCVMLAEKVLGEIRSFVPAPSGRPMWFATGGSTAFSLDHAVAKLVECKSGAIAAALMEK